MKRIEVKYHVIGKEKSSLFKEFEPFERTVDVDELVDMLRDIKVVVYEATRKTEFIEMTKAEEEATAWLDMSKEYKYE